MPLSAPPGPELAAEIFAGLYPDLDLHAAGSVRIAVPAGTPVYVSPSLQGLAAQIRAAAGEPRQDPAGPRYRRRLRRSRFRRARDRANAARVAGRSPGYRVGGEHGRWTAVHLISGTVLGPVRSLPHLAAVIDLDRWCRPARMADGTGITIRAAGGPW